MITRKHFTIADIPGRKCKGLFMFNEIGECHVLVYFKKPSRVAQEDFDTVLRGFELFFPSDYELATIKSKGVDGK